MSDFRPDTRGAVVVTLFQARLFSRALWREEHCKQTSLVCVHSDPATLGLPHSRHVCFPSLHCSGSRLPCRELSDAGPGLHALPRSKLLRFGFSVTPQSCRLLGLRFAPVPGLSSSGDQVLGTRSHPQLKAVTYPLPRPSLLVFWVYSRCTFSLLGS